jgi:hypothetical protein
MRKVSPKDVIEIPRSVWETAETKEDLEDWLLAHNPKMIAELLRIRRKEDLAGKGRSLEDVARRWNIDL